MLMEIFFRRILAASFFLNSQNQEDLNHKHCSLRELGNEYEAI